MNSTRTLPPSAANTDVHKPWLADLLLLSAIWGASFILMRAAVPEFGPLPTAAVRVCVGALFLLPVVWWRGLMPDLRRHWARIFVVGILNSAIPFSCFAFALQSITTGLSAILNATVPMFGALVAWLWLKDRPGASRVLGLIAGFAGIAMLAWDKASFKPDASGVAPGWAVIACLVACIFYAIAASYTKRYLMGIPSLVTAAGSLIGASLAMALPTAFLWPAKMPSAHAWLAVVAAGVMCTGVAYMLFFRIIANAGPPRALSSTFLVPVFAVIYGAIFIQETITPWMVFCALVIVCGTALSTGLIRLGLSAAP
ncbi:carboxylate/amino acid/amine transporter [compost metagenome]|uniref:DMT family transporter n=1 Tax=Polaromonas aquatica TaxID=332657 RepID=A0ABW1TVR5_9BURK